MTTSTPRILLLDDDYASLAPLKELLETICQYKVDLTAAAEILEKLRYTRYDLLCVDTMIHPKSIDGKGNEVHNIHFDNINWQLTGLAFVKFLREGQLITDQDQQSEQGTIADVPIIVLSAVAHDSVDEYRPTEYPNTYHMEKPFNVEILIHKIQELLER